MPGTRRDAPRARPDDSLRIEVRLTPRAGTDLVDGVRGGILRCRVAAPPVEGAANDALLQLLARELGLPPTSLRLINGERGRHKIVALPATERSRVAARWPGLVR